MRIALSSWSDVPRVLGRRRYGRGIGCHREPSEPKYAVKEERVKVPMRDGVYLAAEIYRPDAAGHFPILMLCATSAKGNGRPFLFRARLRGGGLNCAGVWDRRHRVRTATNRGTGSTRLIERAAAVEQWASAPGHKRLHPDHARAWALPEMPLPGRGQQIISAASATT